MNTYLLLRDNKQTGPYTAEELAAKGLKPYDLVWLEGRSAAWRYPSEIEELKSFAPGVEEQPYDRFYKKQAEQPAASSVTEQQQTSTATTQQENQPVNKQTGISTGKHIYVTLPGGKTPVPVAKKEESAKPVARQNDTNVDSATQKNTEKKAAASSYIISEEDDQLNSSLLKGYKSRQKEDVQINDAFLSDYEARKAAYSKKGSGGGSTIKHTAEKTIEKPAAIKPKESWSTPKTSRKETFDLKALLAGSGKYLQDNKNVTRALVAAVLILGGVVIGLVINSGRQQPDTAALESLVKEIREQQNEKSSATAPVTEKPAKKHQTKQREEEPVAGTDDANNNTDQAPPPSTSATNNAPAQSNMRHAVIKKDNNVVPSPQQNKSIVVPVSNPNNPTTETTPVTEPREKNNNQEMIEKARKNIYEQVRAEASAFKVGILGGISDLDITVLNSSLYTLDQVAVEVKYFGPEKKLVKTQTIIFNNVPAGKRRTLEVPSTKRGITIDYSITSINSKALGLASAGF
ncbi:DUF4339 domain-containing protein [Longitalea arenae]|uniref:DUF4339 domain-containing protein n=1 Tax=Longitalea arenae TaxID=2812558 RepID=UPI001967BAA5|nr:DUF4339 domain-containing protein [Longitalea arenae]